MASLQLRAAGASPELFTGSPPWIAGHRGAAGEAVENTLASVLRAVAEGADCVEIDLQLARDGTLVAYHDWSLDRLANRGGTIEEMSWEELSLVDLGGPTGERPPGRIASAAELLAALPPSVPVNLELKRRHASRTALARALIELEAPPRLLASSSDWQLLAEVRSLAPHLRLAPIADAGLDPALILAAAEELGAWSLHVHWSLATEQLLAAAGDRPVLVFTVNSRQRARSLFARGFAGVFSDCPGRLRRALESSSSRRAPVALAAAGGTPTPQP